MSSINVIDNKNPNFFMNFLLAAIVMFNNGFVNLHLNKLCAGNIIYLESLSEGNNMTSRERVLAALRHEPTDRVPFSLGYGINKYAREQLAKRLNRPLNEIESRLAGLSEFVRISPKYIGPSDRGPQFSTEKADIWGVRRKAVFNGFDYYDEISHYPLAGLGETVSLDDYEFPSPDWFDFNSLDNIIREVNKDGERAIAIGNGNIFEHSWYMTGLENMLVLFHTEPGLVYELFEKVTGYYIAFFERALNAMKGRIDIICTAGDIAQQQGLLVSLPMWEELIKPHHVKMNKKLHEYGVQIMYHTDGAVMEAVDGLVDMGIDILDPLQFDAKDMDPVKLKNKWGNKISFHGGVSVQKTLPFGSPDDVRKEVRERIAVMGKGGGYILAPSHAVQGGTPPENILAFLEEAGHPLY